MVVANFDWNYCRYLLGDRDAPLSFMTITSFGPFNVLNEDHMEMLGPLFLGLSMQEARS